MSSDPTKSGSSNRWAVLLLAHGAPDRLSDIPEFLLNVRGGRKLPEQAVQEIIHRYSLIGGGSPLLRLTLQQARSLANSLNHPVYVGMRNWKPFIAEAVCAMRDAGVEQVIALCLAPQNSQTSIGLYRKHLEEAIAQHAPQMAVVFIENWHDHPLLFRAFAERALAGLAGAEREAGGPVPVIFTAHSVPQKTIDDGDAYEDQVWETARGVAGGMDLEDYLLAFQSQGMTAEAWIGPTVESQLDELAARGHRHVLLVPIGFVSDHVEILYDIDVLFRKYGESKGITVHRSESLNDSPLLIQAMSEIVTARISMASHP